LIVIQTIQRIRRNTMPLTPKPPTKKDEKNLPPWMKGKPPKKK